MTSLFDTLNSKIPDTVKTREDIVEWLLENGIYIHKDDSFLPLNLLCNHVDRIIIKLSKEVAGHPANNKFYTLAMYNYVFNKLSEARAANGGYTFTISTNGGAE
jgi:hypothetical protein